MKGHVPVIRTLGCFTAFLCLLLLGIRAKSQTADPAPATASATANSALPADPDAFMRQAADAMSLTASDMKPWHMKAKVRYFGPGGTVRNEEELEEWWAAPNHFSIHLAGEKYAWTEYHNEKGSFLTGDDPRTPGGFPNYLLFHPLPRDPRLEKVTFTSKEVSVGVNKLQCYSEAPKDPSEKLAIASSYCFSQAAPILRMSLDSYGNRITWNGIVRVNGHYVAKQISMSTAQQNPSSTMEVEEIEGGLGIQESALDPPADARPLPPLTVDVSAMLMAGNKIAGANPSYPSAAKLNRVEGTVVLKGTIGKDGSVRGLRVVSGPSELESAATDAVKTWRYRPYLVDGEPVELETTINVVFHLGR